MITSLFLSALSGFLAKTTDALKTRAAYLTGIGYGAALGLVCAAEPLVAVVFLPAVAANVLARKIDTGAHLAGLATFAAVLALRGAAPFSAPLAALAFAAAFLDETMDLKLPYPRPLLPLAAVGASFVLRSPVPIASVLLFDAGYWVAARTVTRKKRQKN